MRILKAGDSSGEPSAAHIASGTTAGPTQRLRPLAANVPPRDREARQEEAAGLWRQLRFGLVYRCRAVSVRFGDCELDTGARELRRAGRAVALAPKAYQLLELLVEQRPKAVSKREIHDRLWPSTLVSEANLSALIFEIRAALGDDARRPRYVRTVRGFGYAFCGEGRATPTVSRC
jgi:DNA-binding winged helix-turn-helix (wHTH) protein